MAYSEEVKKAGDKFVDNQHKHAESQKQDAQKQTENNANAARKVGENLENR